MTPGPFPSRNHSSVWVFKCLLRLTKNVGREVTPFLIMSEEGNEFGSWEHDQLNHTMLKRVCPKHGPSRPWREHTGEDLLVLSFTKYQSNRRHGLVRQKHERECVSHRVSSDSATPWSVTRQAPLSMGFSRQEYWSG